VVVTCVYAMLGGMVAAKGGSRSVGSLGLAVGDTGRGGEEIGWHGLIPLLDRWCWWMVTGSDATIGL